MSPLIGSGASATLRAGSRSVEVWLVDLERSAPMLATCERALPRLSPAERARLLRISNPRERRHRRAAYIALRVVLRRFADASPRRQAIVRPPGSRPRLAGGGPLFSLAYSDGMALIAAASAGHGPAVLGVDLEADRRIAMPAHRRAEIVAAATGLAGMPAAGPPGDAAFLVAWARLEAFAKAHGRGLGRTLVDLGLRAPGPRHLGLEEIEERARSLADHRAVAVHDLALPKGHYGALAMPHSWSPPPVRALPCSLRALERQLHL